MTGASANSMPLMTVLTERFNPRDTRGGLSEAMLSGALRMGDRALRCARTAGERQYERADTVAAAPGSRRRRARRARDGFRTLAGGAKVE